MVRVSIKASIGLPSMFCSTYLFSSSLQSAVLSSISALKVASWRWMSLLCNVSNKYGVHLESLISPNDRAACLLKGYPPVDV